MCNLFHHKFRQVLPLPILKENKLLQINNETIQIKTAIVAIKDLILHNSSYYIFSDKLLLLALLLQQIMVIIELGTENLMRKEIQIVKDIIVSSLKEGVKIKVRNN